MNNNNITLSPEAKNLIARTIEWLQPKGRWAAGWASIKNKEGKEYFVDEKWDMFGRGWEDQEEVIDEHFDESTGLYHYEFDYPWKGVEPEAACVLGALIINNDYKKDRVFEEAQIALAKLIHPKYDSEEDYELETADNIVIDFNDQSPHKQRVMRLLRKAIGRK